MDRPQNFLVVTEPALLLDSYQEVLSRFKLRLEYVMEETNQMKKGDGSSSCLPRPLLSLILLSLCHSPDWKVYFTLAVFTNFDWVLDCQYSYIFLLAYINLRLLRVCWKHKIVKWQNGTKDSSQSCEITIPLKLKLLFHWNLHLLVD